MSLYVLVSVFVCVGMCVSVCISMYIVYVKMCVCVCWGVCVCVAKTGARINRQVGIGNLVSILIKKGCVLFVCFP